MRTLCQFVLCLLFTGCVTPIPPDLKGKVTALPASVHQGETILVQFQLQSSQATPVPNKGVTLVVGEAPQNGSEAQIVNRPRVFACPAGFCALVGVGLDQPVGNVPIALKVSDGRTLDSTHVSVRASEKPVERLKVDPSRVKISAEDQRRIDEERAAIHAVLNSARTEDLESLAFQKPTRSKETSAFGKKRIFNGEPRGYHMGVDLRAGVGAKVRAANSGVVRLARMLFMAGGHVLVDHGGGVFSSYSHLSEILVKENQRIGAGELVGKAGATGRVTAPHLHWSVRLEGIAVDPIQFLEALEPLHDANLAKRRSAPREW